MSHLLELNKEVFMKVFLLTLLLCVLVSGCRTPDTPSEYTSTDNTSTGRTPTNTMSAGSTSTDSTSTGRTPTDNMPTDSIPTNGALSVETAGMSTDAPSEPDPRQEAISARLSDMSLEEKAGQLFFVRCPASGAAEAVATYHLGGLVLFTQDFKDTDGSWLSQEAVMEKLVSFQDAASLPLLIGVDEEGGTVARTSRNPNLFPQKCQSPQKLFAQGGLDAIRQDAAFKSATLLALGIQVNLAPVADVSTHSQDFIYDRSFGQDASATADYITAVVEEMQAAGIGSVLKHFPGYGNNADTHTGIAIDERPMETFTTEDFLPFAAGIEAGANAVMVSHNIVTCMDDVLPASLSPEVHRILREELGFTGVILTDDLAMDAVEHYAEDGSAVVLAVRAGNDMVITSNFEEQIPQIIDAVNTGLVSMDRLDAAVTQVLGWKYDLGLLT